MKLLEVNTVAVGGSIPGYMRAIVDEAQRRGWQVAVAKGRRADMPGVDNIQIGTRLNTAVHGLATRLFDAHGLVGRAPTLRFIAAAERFDPDVIHLHNIHGYYLHFPTLMQWLAGAGKPVFWSLHDFWPLTGHCPKPYTAAGPCTRWHDGCHDCPLRDQYPASSLLDRSALHYALKEYLFTSVPNLTLLPVSQWLADQLEYSYLRDIPRLVASIDIDTDVFRPMGVPSVPRVLGVAAKWAPVKGLDFFVRLRAELSDDVEIRLLGAVPRGLPKGIDAPGPVNSPQALAREYSAATVMLSASLCETYGVAVREALACGCPVVCRDGDAITEGLGGAGDALVSASTDEELVSAVRAALRADASVRTAARTAAEALYAGKPGLARIMTVLAGAAKC